MIAALFVETGGVYFGLPGVEPWDKSRDARSYGGPHPVVAHPPCARWCRLAGLVEARWGNEGPAGDQDREPGGQRTAHSPSGRDQAGVPTGVAKLLGMRLPAQWMARREHGEVICTHGIWAAHIWGPAGFMRIVDEYGDSLCGAP